MDSMGTPEEVIVQGNENTLEGHSEQMKGMTPEQKKFVQDLLKENHKLSQENMILKKEKSNLQSASDKTDSKEPFDNESKANDSSKRKSSDFGSTGNPCSSKKAKLAKILEKDSQKIKDMTPEQKKYVEGLIGACIGLGEKCKMLQGLINDLHSILNIEEITELGKIFGVIPEK